MPLFRMADSVPDNVPHDRIFEFDVYETNSVNQDFQHKMYELREQQLPSIFWTPRNGGHWVATRAAEIDLILNNTQIFSNQNLRVPKEINPTPPMKPIQVDPPQHKKYRELLMAALAPKQVAILGEGARELAIRLIDGFAERGECEFVSDFAQNLPIAVFMKMVDLPIEDRPLLIDISEAVVRPKFPEERNEGFRKLQAYALRKVEERRALPGTDLISMLGRAEIDGEPLSDDDLRGMLTLLLLAGLDTVQSMLSYFARFLAHNPGHRQQLIDDPALIPNAIEELLRRFAIVNLGREVLKDVEIGGIRMQAGDMVIAPTPLSNLDETKFQDPWVVDFKRKVGANTTFGGGAHRCMGAMLARAELRIFLEEWLPRIPHFDIKPGATITDSGTITSVIPSLPLIWNVADVRKVA